MKKKLYNHILLKLLSLWYLDLCLDLLETEVFFSSFLFTLLILFTVSTFFLILVSCYRFQLPEVHSYLISLSLKCIILHRKKKKVCQMQSPHTINLGSLPTKNGTQIEKWWKHFCFVNKLKGMEEITIWCFHESLRFIIICVMVLSFAGIVYVSYNL